MLLLLTVLSLSVIALKGEQYTFNNITLTLSRSNHHKNDDRVIVTTNAINDEILHDYRITECLQQNIPSLPSNSIANLTSLKRLTFNSTNTSAIAANAIYNVPKLKVLTITNNPTLKELPKNAFNCTALRVLVLRDNGLEQLSTLEGVPKLRQLDLSGNRLKTIEATFFSATPELYDVHFSRNRLKEIPEGAFKYLQGVFNVFLDHNEISGFSDLAFKDGAKIGSLMVNGNELEDFNALGNVDLVEWLELSANDIECLDLVDMEKVKVLMADANPWQCDCLQNFTERTNGRFYANAELARCLFDE